MNINVYLPDELGQRAKDAGLNFSGLLRAAVHDELKRRTTVASTLSETAEHELDLETENGDPYVGRITGTVIGQGRNAVVYLTDDERVLAYDEDKLKVYTLDDPVVGLEGWLDGNEYINAVIALGEKPIVDL